ncbi:hypothetical protein LX32DRAFT_318955 [Colletotrichum zoysiae]|uniref:Uncharacterized protein n=1 Tax=Colletotrichum zoysiae TaxID=1216348 RepID=A0AAD9H2V2_9PEZI|nr:hypothetical protein LX32DRAFT_318955 [Colletotrichum zoysiae]
MVQSTIRPSFTGIRSPRRDKGGRGADLDVGGGDPRAGAPPRGMRTYAAPTLTERVAYIVCTAEIFLSSFWDGSNRQRCRCAAGATVYLEQSVRTMMPLCGTIPRAKAKPPKSVRRWVGTERRAPCPQKKRHGLGDQLMVSWHDGMDRLGREDPMQVSSSRHVSSLGLACSARTCSPSCTGVSRSLRGT